MSRLESLASLVPSQCLEGSYKTSPCWRFQNRLQCRFVWWHFVTFQHVSCRRVKRGLVRQAQNFYDVFRRCVAFFVEGAALWRPSMSFCVAGAALSVCRVANLLPIALSGLREVVTLTLHALHFTLHTLHSTLCTLHFKRYTQHSTLYTSHSTLYTLHFPLHTPNFTLYTLHSTLHTLRPTLYTPHLTLYTLHFTLYTLHSTLYTSHPTLYTPHFTLFTLHSTLHIFYSTLYTLHSTLYTPFLFSHNYDSGVRYPTCGHSGSWASSCFLSLPGATTTNSEMGQVLGASF